MKQFKSKAEVFEYISNKFNSKKVKGIAIVGSTAKKSIKNFSDIDVVVFNEKPLKPFYEICLVKENLVLITVYFYKAGKKTKLPENGKILKGDYFEQIEHKKSSVYNSKQRAIRDNQMFLDGLFKFLRSKDKKYLNWVEKYSRI